MSRPTVVLAMEAPLEADVIETPLPASQPDISEDGSSSGVIDAALCQETVSAELGDESRPAGGLTRFVRAVFRIVLSTTDWLFGAAALIVGLSFLSTYPLLQMLSLGYLLEASGRIARTGRLRDGFVGVRKASRVGSLVFGAWLVLLPLRFVSNMAASARLIDPDSRATRGWSMALAVLTALAVVHIIGACWRGGRLRHFLWPRPIRVVKSLLRRGAYSRSRDAVWDFVTSLRLPYYFWLGIRGFVGGLIWLFIPISLLAAGLKAPPVGLLGALALMWVLLYLPFVQARFAAENRFRAQFEISEIRKLFRRAPVLFWLSLFCTLLFALPLYLLKIEIVPREAAWLPSLLFVVFIYPARLLTGWSCGLARRREKNRNFFMRQVARLAMLPVVAFYVFIVFLTQYTSWHGVASLYEQHAFLVPVPFLGL
ncbi:MAG TPA: hypothetical protein VHC22_30965 [Pirellulales bacterium]|nr:hypothetical protein [Pirellulales bacterium]